ncbi:MAG: hypothetical protein V1697_01610 [Candidatus Levyibacteriota bacterium]
MKAYEIKVKGKVLDYRIGKDLDLKEVRRFFAKNYKVKRIWQEKRHVVGILEKNSIELFLKLSPTEGISAVTQIEYNWNDQFNKLVSRKSNFWVPKNIYEGFYKKNLFYLITDYFKGESISEVPHKDNKGRDFKQYLLPIIEFSELIQNLEIGELSEKDKENHSKWFLEKTKAWYEAVPKSILEKYKVNNLLEIVENGYLNLEKKTKHGDFTPWHMIKLNEKRIGLIDGEHAMNSGTEYYDTGYLIQRIFTVLKEPDFAKEFFQLLLKRNYNLEKLQVTLAARAIGGFTDEAIIREKANYLRANKFKNWVLSL